MRVLICDDHVIFAESVSHLLKARDIDVVGVTYHPREALAVLRRTPVDICLLDLMFGNESVLEWIGDLRGAARGARFVVLCASPDPALLAAGRTGRVHGIGDKRQSIDEVVDLLTRVHAGGTVQPAADPSAGTVAVPEHGRPANRAAEDAQWLAAFLTPREREVLSGLVRGEDTLKLASTLGIAQTTARCHIQAVLTKLGAHSRLEAATTAVRSGMIDPQNGRWQGR